MGSGQNWVGYHLITYLALQTFFAEHDRPVPRFLMLDQPTQAFYSPDALPGARPDITDSDRQAVARMFALLRRVAEERSPQLQIIVMDHENPDRPGLPAVVVEEWRGGLKLVPDDWPG